MADNKSSSGPKNGKKKAGNSPKKPAAKKAAKPVAKRAPAKKAIPKNSGPRAGKGFKYLLICLFAFGIILIGLIVHFDKKAVEKGQVGIWETVTRTDKAQTRDEVENRTKLLIQVFSEDRAVLIREGKTRSRDNDAIDHLIYRIPDLDMWKRFHADFETKVGKSGLTVHNRTFTKSIRDWTLTYFVGTTAERTLKLVIECQLKPGEDQPDPTREPAAATQIPIQAKIALVIDDFGQDLNIARRFVTELKAPFTLAVMPYLDHSGDIVDLARKTKQTPFLHLPMEPMDSAQMGDARGFLTVDMSDDEIKASLLATLKSMPRVDGVNNHMGSRFTSDARAMKAVMATLKPLNRPFLDSRTIHTSVAADIARESGIRCGARDVFIDQGYKGGDVKANMEKLVGIALKNGSAIGIGHARPETLEAIIESLAMVRENGVHIVPVTLLLK